MHGNYVVKYAILSYNQVPNLVVLKLIELFLHCKQPIWVALGFEDVLGLNMWNKSKIAINIMEFGASSYPLGYITYDEVLGMICSISPILWKWLWWFHFNFLSLTMFLILWLIFLHWWVLQWYFLHIFT